MRCIFRPTGLSRRALHFSTGVHTPTLLYAKGAMMLVVGILASVLLQLRRPKAMTALFLAVAVWGFCRAYYFAKHSTS